MWSRSQFAPHGRSASARRSVMGHGRPSGARSISAACRPAAAWLRVRLRVETGSRANHRAISISYAEGMASRTGGDWGRPNYLSDQSTRGPAHGIIVALRWGTFQCPSTGSIVPRASPGMCAVAPQTAFRPGRCPGARRRPESLEERPRCLLRAPGAAAPGALCQEVRPDQLPVPESGSRLDPQGEGVAGHGEFMAPGLQEPVRR